MNKDKKNSQGFTLIEIIFASAIFAGILGTIIVFGSRALEAQAKSRAMQNTLDNVRFAMEGINKKIRTSNSIANNNGDAENYPDGGSNLFVIDNLDDTRYCYQFYDNGSFTGLYAAKDFSSPPTSTKCSDFPNIVTNPTSWKLVAGSDKVDVDGRFIIKTTSTSGANRQRGMVTTVMDVTYTGGNTGKVSDTDSIKVQTTVSVRDYFF